MVVGGKDCTQASSLIEEVLIRCKNPPREFRAPLNGMLTKYAKKINMRPVKNDIIHALAVDDLANHYCQSESTVLYPDQAVFLGPVLNCRTVEDYVNTDILDVPREYVILKGVGVFISKNFKAGVEEMLTCHAEVLMRISIGAKLCYLSEENVRELIDWEPEKYRQNLGK